MSGAAGRESLAAARDLPDDEAKVAELERIAAHADAAGDVRLGVDARLALIETYQYRGERWRLAEPLHRCLAAVDRQPALFDADDAAALLWGGRATVEAVSGSPRVGLDQARALLDDLADRLAGTAPGTVAELRCRLADHLGDEPAAREWFTRWQAAGPGPDCAGCVAVRQAELLTGWGRWTEAVRLLEPVTVDPGDCTDQPEAALAALLLPYLRLGRYDDAGRAHVRAYRRHRREWGAFGHLPAHLLFCALGGHPARGLEILVEQLPRLTGPVDERYAMELAAAGALLCRIAAEAGLGHPAGPADPAGFVGRSGLTLGLDHATPLAEAFGLIRVSPPGEGPRLAALGAELLAAATDLAGRFDARNGTGHQSGRVAARLAERPLTTAPPPLPVEPVAGDGAPAAPLDAATKPAAGPAGTRSSASPPATANPAGSPPSDDGSVGAGPADEGSVGAGPADDGPADVPAPLSVDMVVAALRRRGDRCVVDPAGRVVGRWGAAEIRFERVGQRAEILHTRVLANRRLPVARRAEAYEFVNTWNRDRLLPKAYVHEVSGGELVLAGEVTTDLAHGIAPVQVEVLVEAAVSTGTAYADAVAALP
ncbi:Putative sensory transduction regulator [Micromonospora pallida]|uniref:Putative sensory transduction regulator n=1 Tax=Micromonospora pallida TaxID=145854 RepID=A0A1C6SUY7_9ACTN|nr:YbjN domain-containing protein [Micromonospora pallida]SCL33444.1 Putative sensory transduction regulator [Micromonospora pallida]